MSVFAYVFTIILPSCTAMTSLYGVGCGKGCPFPSILWCPYPPYTTITNTGHSFDWIVDVCFWTMWCWDVVQWTYVSRFVVMIDVVVCVVNWP